MRRFAVALVLSLALAGPAWADFASAARAFDAGDYATAYAEWLALAKDGDMAAQSAVAAMHRYGVGRPVDAHTAIMWYRRAAERGDAGAQLNLGEMYLNGEGVAADRVEAFVWFSLSARQGRVRAARRQAELEGALGPEQRREADRLIELRSHISPTSE